MNIDELLAALEPRQLQSIVGYPIYNPEFFGGGRYKFLCVVDQLINVVHGFVRIEDDGEIVFVETQRNVMEDKRCAS